MVLNSLGIDTHFRLLIQNETIQAYYYVHLYQHDILLYHNLQAKYLDLPLHDMHITPFHLHH